MQLRCGLPERDDHAQVLAPRLPRAAPGNTAGHRLPGDGWPGRAQCEAARSRPGDRARQLGAHRNRRRRNIAGGLTTGWFWSAYRRKVRNWKLGLALILGLAGLFVLGMAVTRQAVAPQIGQPDPVTTPVQFGAIAFMVPFYCALLALCAYTYLQTRKKRENTVGRHAVESAGAQGDLLTALIGHDKAGGWSVTWVSDGKTPKKLTAPTLTALAERAAAAAVELLANQRASTTAELQLAIYPGPYQSGPIWEITGSAGGLTATDRKSTRLNSSHTVISY